MRVDFHHTKVREGDFFILTCGIKTTISIDFIVNVVVAVNNKRPAFIELVCGVTVTACGRR